MVGAAVGFGLLGTRPAATGGLATAGIVPLRTVVTAEEDASYTASLRKVGGGPVGKPLKGLVKAYRTPRIGFKGALRAGTYEIRIVLSALANPGRRTSFTSKPFVVRRPRR